MHNNNNNILCLYVMRYNKNLICFNRLFVIYLYEMNNLSILIRYHMGYFKLKVIYANYYRFHDRNLINILKYAEHLESVLHK